MRVEIDAVGYGTGRFSLDAGAWSYRGSFSCILPFPADVATMLREVVSGLCNIGSARMAREPAACLLVVSRHDVGSGGTIGVQESDTGLVLRADCDVVDFATAFLTAMGRIGEKEWRTLSPDEDFPHEQCRKLQEEIELFRRRDETP
ncbi:hypothetical protein [Calidifontibacter terrae]